MFSSLSLDQLEFLVQERRAQAEHAALVHQALAMATPRRSPLRPRLAAALRDLAYRLDESLALAA